MFNRFFAFHCGTELCPEQALDPASTDAASLRRMPYFFYLIEHSKGLVAFDTGPNPEFIRRGVEYFGPEASSWRVSFNEGDDARSQLERIGIATADVAHVVLSHLHYDHAGGMQLFENATFWVQRKEWEFATDPLCPQRLNYVQGEFDVPRSRLRLIEGEQDLFDDGTMVMFPTPGHTAGHQSLAICGPAGAYILAGDAAYRSNLDDPKCVPGPAFMWNERSMLESIERLRNVRDEHSAEVVVTHEFPSRYRPGLPVEYR